MAPLPVFEFEHGPAVPRRFLGENPGIQAQAAPVGPSQAGGTGFVAPQFQFEPAVQGLGQIEVDELGEPAEAILSRQAAMEGPFVQGADDESDLAHKVLYDLAEMGVLAEGGALEPQDQTLVGGDVHHAGHVGFEIHRRAVQGVGNERAQPQARTRPLRKKPDVAQELFRLRDARAQFLMAVARQAVEPVGDARVPDVFQLEKQAVLAHGPQKVGVERRVEDIEELPGDGDVVGAFVDEVFGVEGRQRRGTAVEPEKGGREVVDRIGPARVLGERGQVAARKGQGEIGPNPQPVIKKGIVIRRRAFLAGKPAQQQDRLEKRIAGRVGQQRRPQSRRRSPSRIGHVYFSPVL